MVARTHLSGQRAGITASSDANELRRRRKRNGSHLREPFAAVHNGSVDNPYYQAFLDTVEQPELIHNNAPYFA